jgi:hypothetical protein
MPRVISINAPPGTLRGLLADIPKHPGVLMLPTSTSETNTSSIHGSLVECLQSALHRMAHISRCEDSAAEIIVCTHWYDAPLLVPRQDRAFVHQFLERHVRAMVEAHGLRSIEHRPVILDLDTSYAFEILIEEMSAGSMSSHHIDEYMTHLKGAVGPSATVIPVSSRLFDTTYLRQQLIIQVLKTINQSSQHGLPKH